LSRSLSGSRQASLRVTSSAAGAIASRWLLDTSVPAAQPD